MKTFTTKASVKLQQNLIATAIIIFFFSFSSKAQFRSYSQVYSDNLKGGTTLIGNTLTHIIANGVADTAKMNGNRANGNSSFGNDNSNIQFVDVDGSTGIGAGTRNSSSADLSLPTGTNTIKLARLYWGGRVKKSDFDITLDTFRRIKIKYGVGSYAEYNASQLDKNTSGTGNSIVNQYQAYVDITSFIQANGSGTYTVGNAPLSVGAVGNGGNYGGWCIVIVYENLALPVYNSVRVYDGFQQVFNGGASQISTVTLTGLNVPSGAMSMRDAKMGAMVWEGDANLKLDYLKINNLNFSNSLNAVDNPWNGTITDTGRHVTTKNPNYTNQMGIDIDQFYVGTGYGIQPGDSSVKLEFGTEADQYFPGLFTFQIKTNDPTIVIDKLVKDANNNKIAEAGEVLTYTLKGRNAGVGNANNSIITDTLPVTMTYVPGSMRVITCAGLSAGASLTDYAGDDQGEYIANDRVVICRIGTGANAINGGILAPDESFEIEFQVTVNTPANGGDVPAIINVARVTAFSDAGQKSTDDATAIIEPQGGALPVTLINFLANILNNNSVQINWATSMEINCSRYEIERSTDGRTFSAVATVAGGGNKSTTTSYVATDDLFGVNASMIYYRLKQIDIDGKKSISKIISIRLKKAGSDLVVSPNPFSSYVNITLQSERTEQASLKVFGSTGNTIVSKNVSLSKGSNYITISEMQKLPPGAYVLQFNTAGSRVIKQITKL